MGAGGRAGGKEVGWWVSESYLCSPNTKTLRLPSPSPAPSPSPSPLILPLTSRPPRSQDAAKEKAIKKIMKNASKMFTKLDTDMSGTLSKAEIMAGHKLLRITALQASKLFDDLDTDGNGTSSERSERSEPGAWLPKPTCEPINGINISVESPSKYDRLAPFLPSLTEPSHHHDLSPHGPPTL